MRCSCVKKGSQCGPGCTCRDCKNTETEKREIELDSDSETSATGSGIDSDEAGENIETEVITGLEYEYDELM